MKVNIILNKIYLILILFTGIVFSSCSTPEEKWIADYKTAKCELQKLDEKVEEETKKELKDTLKAKEILEKDLKQLTSPDEKKIASLNESLKKSDEDYDKKIAVVKEELKKAKTKEEEKAVNKKIEALETQKIETGKDIGQRIFVAENEMRRKAPVKALRDEIKSKDRFIKERTEERKSKYKGEIKRIQNRILEFQKNKPAKLEEEAFKKQIEEIDKSPCQ